MTNVQVDPDVQVGTRVQVIDDSGVCVSTGVCEYITGGWAGVREDSGRLDEWPADMLGTDEQ